MNHRAGRVRIGTGLASSGSVAFLTSLTLLLGACSSVPEPPHCPASASRFPINTPTAGQQPVAGAASQLSELGGSHVPAPC